MNVEDIINHSLKLEQSRQVLLAQALRGSHLRAGALSIVANRASDDSDKSEVDRTTGSFRTLLFVTNLTF